jgi:hypothetical protein
MTLFGLSVQLLCNPRLTTVSHMQTVSHNRRNTERFGKAARIKISAGAASKTSRRAICSPSSASRSSRGCLLPCTRPEGFKRINAGRAATIRARGQSMANLVRVVYQLKVERDQAQRWLEQLNQALKALTELGGLRRGGGRNQRPVRRRKTMSTAARRESLASNACWAKSRATKATALRLHYKLILPELLCIGNSSPGDMSSVPITRLSDELSSPHAVGTYVHCHAEHSKRSAFRFFQFLFRLRGFGGSAGPDGTDEAGAAVFSCASLGGNFVASFTMAAARSLLILHAGS